jgi:hypothetical protein
VTITELQFCGSRAELCLSLCERGKKEGLRGKRRGDGRREKSGFQYPKQQAKDL